MNKVYLLLGSNEGSREAWLRDCINHLQAECGDIIDKSGIWETAAWGIEDQPAFLNMAVCLATGMPALELLSAIQNIEQRLGRQREVKWGQRTLDIDILFYNLEVIDLPYLKVPHPYLQERRFALVPLNDIAPGLTHPVFHKTVRQLLDECTDQLEVWVYQK